MSSEMKQRAILLFLQNRPGVLNKISMLIRKKMYNVDTLTVCRAKADGVSRMTITLRENDDAKVLQVIRQLDKFTEVMAVKELNRDQSYWREVAILKIDLDVSRIDALAPRYNLEYLDSGSADSLIVQIAGASRHIDDFMDEIGPEHVIEIARTGVTALEK